MYFYFALPGLILGLIAQFLISIRYNKYSKIPAESHMTGLDAAELIRDREDFPIDIATNQGKLQDNFDPRKDIVNISSDNINSNSVANIAVVAHEFGHVGQKFSSSFLFKLRTFMVPVVNIGSSLGYVLFFVGLILNALNLAQIGLILFASTTVFALVTLPVEFDASKRGLKFIKKYNLIEADKQSGAKKVLNAAALTYVASFVTSLLNLLYYASILNNRKGSR
ncbi:MAG TPA: zinc metallopeptidase [Candidatus Dojkabacteria bacterium]|nr:zinc metallopeptidase [Candidatus Dojkabacteria bacterium]HOR06094.1 zinc metallopeptidase [Candidatus Dojkabacteria bacterium]HQI92833.1 zinc metallopeptidase [Candidatus Dojkabacteria bacterium]